MWCLWNRPWSCDSTARKACRFRKSCIDWYWDSICTDRKGVISCRIWTWKFPPVHIWTWCDSSEWPQTFGDNTEKASSHCTKTAAENVIALTEVHNTPFIIILVMRYAEHIWETMLNAETIHLARFLPVIEDRVQKLRRKTQVDEID